MRKRKEQPEDVVTIPRWEYDDLRQEVTDFAAAVRMWKEKYEEMKANYDVLMNTCALLADNQTKLAEANAWYAEQLKFVDTGKPKKCEPYQGPKVVQMFPTSKSE